MFTIILLPSGPLAVLKITEHPKSFCLCRFYLLNLPYSNCYNHLYCSSGTWVSILSGNDGRPGLPWLRPQQHGLEYLCFRVSGNVWWEDSSVLSLMSPLSLFKRNSTLLPGTEVIEWGRLGSPLVNILFRTKLLSLVPLSWDMDCLLILWLILPLVPLVTVAVHLVFWSLSFLKEVSCTAAYIYS